MDGTYDSDEDADFTKMDMVRMEWRDAVQMKLTDHFFLQGNKKGPVKRWDFENDDEYNQYQSKREALPK